MEILDKQNVSCVIRNHGAIRTFTGRGVSDLFHLYSDDPSFLDGAEIADKVVGKGAAAIMVLGKAATLHTHLISDPALEMLTKSGVAVSYDEKVPHILNRSKQDWCPVEKRLRNLSDAQACWPEIVAFVQEIEKSCLDNQAGF